MPDEPTLGELRRNLARVEDECTRRAATHVSAELWRQQLEADQVRHTQLREELREVRESLRWAWRTAAGAVIVSVVTLLFRALGAGGLT